MTVCLIIHVFCKSWEPEIVFVLICTLAEQFHVLKSYKTRELTLSCIGNSEENIDLSQIYLAVSDLAIESAILSDPSINRVVLDPGYRREQPRGTRGHQRPICLRAEKDCGDC